MKLSISRRGDFLVKEETPLIMRISGSKTLSSFPEGNDRKVSILEGSIKRRESLTNEIDEEDQLKDQSKMIHILEENDQIEKWYCHYSSLLDDRYQIKMLHNLEENDQNKKWYCHYSSLFNDRHQSRMLHNLEENDQNKKWYCHYSSLFNDRHQSRMLHNLEENDQNEKWYRHYSHCFE
ncbi:hypothetical protein Tco_1167805 [Tanacetum coccineum]